jgi:hypothetical protein
MKQERVKCPFCSELILREAIKCRFCGEWFSEPDQDIEAVTTIQDSDFEDFDKEHYPLVIQNTHGEFPSFRAGQLRGFQKSQSINDQEEKQVENVEDVKEVSEEVPPMRIAKEIVQAEQAGLKPVREGSRIPWLRAFLLVFYLGIVSALGFAEFMAHEILNEAQIQEDAEDFNTAFSRYRAVQNTFPFTFTNIEARKSLVRLSESKEELELPKPAWLAACEDLLNVELKKQDVHLLPLVAWPISAFVLFLVFLTRIRRFGIAFIAFILMILAISGSIAQLAWYGLVPVVSVTEVVGKFMLVPEVLYIMSYSLLILTAFMTLTAPVARINLHIAKMNAASATKY